MKYKSRICFRAKGLLVALSLLFVGCGPSGEQLRISALDHFKRGNHYYQNKQLQEAAAEYQKAIAQDPQQERFYYNLGLVYYSLVLYEKAIEEYKVAIKLNPLFAEVWFNLALAYEKTDDTERAFWAYDKYKTLRQQNKKKQTNPQKPVVKSNS